MEHVTSALSFPETEPSIHGMAKFLIFFDALSYYLPTESDRANNRDNSFFTNLCTGYAPAPLGEDLARFNRLLREMETSRPGEFSRLFSAAKAPVATGPARDQDENSASSVLSAMQMDADTKTSIQYKERLWQARLVLKLAEMLDRREAEVRQGLAQVSSDEHKVFASLEGLGEAQTDDLAELSSPGKLQHPKGDDILPDEPSLGTSGLLIPLRLKAWAELYLADSSGQLPVVLATANPESGLTLLDGYENTWRRDPRKLFSLSIPALQLAGIEGAWDQYLTSRNTFREAAQENLEYFARFLQETAGLAGSATANQEEISMLAENISTWEEKVKVHFPGRKTDLQKLDLYCFPGISLAELFHKLFHLEGPVPANKQEHPTGLLAILNP